MPFKDPEKQKEFQRNWIAKRREQFFSNKECIQCTSKKDLALYGSKTGSDKMSFSESLAKLNQRLLKPGVKILCLSCLAKIKSLNSAKTNTTHGHTVDDKDTPTYVTWACMKQRCYNPNHEKYDYYGGRGITVCDRWKNSFENFLSDMGERPNGTSIDRIDVDGNYEPGNCRWADIYTQNRNKRRR